MKLNVWWYHVCGTSSMSDPWLHITPQTCYFWCLFWFRMTSQVSGVMSDYSGLFLDIIIVLWSHVLQPPAWWLHMTENRSRLCHPSHAVTSVVISQFWTYFCWLGHCIEYFQWSNVMTRSLQVFWLNGDQENASSSCRSSWIINCFNDLNFVLAVW